MAARRSPGVLASVPVKRFSRRGWVISQVLQRGGHLPTPHRTPGHANTGTGGQSRTAARDSEKLGDPACLRLGAVLRGPHGRGARTRRRNTRSPSPQTHARADEQGSAGGLRGQQADSTMYGMEGVGGPRF